MFISIFTITLLFSIVCNFVTNGGKLLKRNYLSMNAVVRDTVGHWQWAYHKNRTIECALARLRIGYVGVRHHLKRFGMVSTDCCLCGAVERDY